MKLFVWRNVFEDYTPGIAFAVATDVESARNLIATKYNKNNGWKAINKAEFELEAKKRGLEDTWIPRDIQREPDVIIDNEYFGDYVMGGG